MAFLCSSDVSSGFVQLT